MFTTGAGETNTLDLPRPSTLRKTPTGAGDRGASAGSGNVGTTGVRQAPAPAGHRGAPSTSSRTRSNGSTSRLSPVGSSTRPEQSSQLRTGKDLRRFSVPDDEPGEDAVTHYRVEQELDRATLVQVQLETGRRNQIRVHFAEAGHPVVGDDKYDPANGGIDAGRRSDSRHATVTGFKHPMTGRELRFESPMPPRFVAFIGKSNHDDTTDTT
ncbi:MAG: pseudouridine synthase [Planctomycetaceae bacterium]